MTEQEFTTALCNTDSQIDAKTEQYNAYHGTLLLEARLHVEEDAPAITNVHVKTDICFSETDSIHVDLFTEQLTAASFEKLWALLADEGEASYMLACIMDGADDDEDDSDMKGDLDFHMYAEFSSADDVLTLHAFDINMHSAMQEPALEALAA